MAYLGRSYQGSGSGSERPKFQFVWLVKESLKMGSRVRFLFTWVQFTSDVYFLFYVYIGGPQTN